MRQRLLFLSILVAGLASAQTASTGRKIVLATGDGSVAVTPDQAKVTLSVVTQAQTAQDASSQNATVASNVISQVRAVLGTSGDIKTISYSLSPLYSYSSNGDAPKLLGYSVTNTIGATVNDIALIGKVIDTGVQAGATRIDSLQFTLKDDSTAKAAALKSATIRAKSKADAMAAALGMRTGAIFAIQEAGATVSPIRTAGAPSASTPVVPGTVEVQANVTIEVELLQ